jgi:chromosome segregation ATPase
MALDDDKGQSRMVSLVEVTDDFLDNLDRVTPFDIGPSPADNSRIPLHKQKYNLEPMYTWVRKLVSELGTKTEAVSSLTDDNKEYINFIKKLKEKMAAMEFEFDRKLIGTTGQIDDEVRRQYNSTIRDLTDQLKMAETNTFLAETSLVLLKDEQSHSKSRLKTMGILTKNLSSSLKEAEGKIQTLESVQTSSSQKLVQMIQTAVNSEHRIKELEATNQRLLDNLSVSQHRINELEKKMQEERELFERQVQEKGSKAKVENENEELKNLIDEIQMTLSPLSLRDFLPNKDI